MARTARIGRRRRVTNKSENNGTTTNRPAARKSTDARKRGTAPKIVPAKPQALRSPKGTGTATTATTHGGGFDLKMASERITMRPSDKDESDNQASAQIQKWFDETCKRGVASVRAEFQELRGYTPHISKTAFDRNDSKNRYRDIICIDDTRVVLRGGGCDYVHASWVSGSGGDRAFICTQGPTDDTTVDFWRMVWQEEVVLIVMLCDLVESGKIKCHAYWPQGKDANMTAGTFTVAQANEPQTIHLLGGERVVLTNLEVTLTGCAPRTVKHLRWPEWPDRGAPKCALSVLKLRQMCVEMCEASPVVVHCSAGIGRTGTIVLIDACIGEIDKKKEINVVEAFKRVRTQRMHSVQTDIQYTFVYQALLDYCVVKLCMDGSQTKEFRRQMAALK